MSVIGHCSLGLRRLYNLENFLGNRCQYVLFRPGSAISGMVGWGLKPAAVKAKNIALKAELPTFALKMDFCALWAWVLKAHSHIVW